MGVFDFVISNLPEALDSGTVIAATRCGALGVLNCVAAGDAGAIRQALARVAQFARGPFGLKLDGKATFASEVLQSLPPQTQWLILTEPGYSAGWLRVPSGPDASGPSQRIVVEVTSADQAVRAVALGCHGLIARGEALAKQLAASTKVPVWVTGIGPDSAAACYAAGVAGVVIEQAPVADAVRSLSAILRGWREALPIERPAVEELPPAKPLDVAIVGMGCILPKAPNLRAFWANILNKVDAITEIPKERFNIDLYYDPDRKSRDKIYSRWGGFLGDVPFDPLRYGIPPNALSSIDPMQLLALVVVDQALRDAGYRDREFPRHKTSVILGLSGGLGDLGIHYAVRSTLPQFISKPPEELLQELPEWTEDSFAGILLNVVAGRVANRFDLGGVNFSVDAACASSLAAVYLAARELADHSSDMAVVGGVDTVQSPFGYLCFAKAQALSGRGRCRTFDETADGIAISEGVSMMVMKRLEDAERDGDRIYAVIKGVCGSSDGRGRSMTAPRLEGQMLALRRAYAQAGIRPSTIGLIEAHGTGTTVGDASELAALDGVFQADGAREETCAVGSVKSMVGHTKSAAGVTGLMKVALALYHKILPPTLHVEKPNPKLLEPGCPFFVNTEPQPWIPADSVPRRAGASAFGFGGTNFHAVLEEYQGDFSEPADRATTEEWPAELFLWNDPTPSALAELSAEKGTLRELAGKARQTHSLPGNRSRLAIVATSPDDLRAKLAKTKTALESKQTTLNDPQGIYLAPVRPEGRAKIAFLFPGQGSQKTGMLRDLALYFPEFRESLETAESVLAGRLPKKLSAYIYPPPAFGPEREKQQNLELTDTVVAQPALGVVEMGLYRLLKRLGPTPDMTAGHSYGEYVALAAAGVFPEPALYHLSESRGRAIKDTTQGEAGTMAAVPADAEAVARALDGMEGITVANHNSPRQTVISGATEAVRSAVERLEGAGLAARPIPVACAFHSPLMEPARERFAEVLARQEFGRPTAEVFSNTLGSRYPEDPREIAELLASHLVRPVKFVEEIRAMYDEGARVFVEAGPKGVLTGLARQILEGKEARFIQIDVADRHGIVQLLHALAQLAVEGAPVDVWQLLRGRGCEAQPEVSQAQWMVNGLKAFPRTQPPREIKPMELFKPVGQVPDPPAAPVQVQQNPAVAAAPMSEIPIPGTGDAVMLQFQQLMAQFLQTQAAVMTAYLQGTPGAPLAMPVLAAPIQPPALAAAQPAPPAKPAQPVVVAPPPASPPAPLRDYTAELLRIASERTGYPPEMLDPGAAIEADLGIDSIKRVEILSGFQKLLSAGEQARLQAIMKQLTGAATLGEIADHIAAALPAAALPAVVGKAVGGPAPSRRDYIAELRRIASERTGYPPEMLDLDAGIEADLGIDSIKRVEILSGFQKLCTADEQAKIQGVMDQLTGARTLREIADRMEAAIPASAPAAGLPAEGEKGGGGAALPERDYIAELRRIASERTGYPPEMLDLDAGIEADLGIDSIKRVEILSGFQKLCTADEQAKIQAIMEQLTGARTLREIADRVAVVLPGPAGGKAMAASAASPLPRFVLAVTAKPRRPAKPGYYPKRVCIITDDETGIAAGIAEELNRAGERAILLRHNPDTRIGDADLFTTDLTDAAAIETTVGMIRQEYGPIGAVIHLLPLRANGSAANCSFAEWRELVQLDVRSLYALARAAEADLKQAGRAGGALFAVATSRGGDFGLHANPATPPTHYGVADFTKTLALEFTDVLFKVVDLDASDPVVILQKKLIEELTSPDETLQVGLPGDWRLTVVPQLEPASTPAVRRIERDWVILVTGGARGITAEVARHLAKGCQPTLVLAGASSLPAGPESPDTAGIPEAAKLKAALTARLKASAATVKPATVDAAYQRLMKDREIRRTLEELRQTGSRVEYHSVDVRDEAAFGELIDGIYRDYGRLDAVIHGAGIIEDKLIRDKTPESFDRVVHTKADSAFLLSRKLRPESLQCLLFMSSITAAFGNRAQADYAAANGIMNGFAAMLAAQWPGRVIAMNWGPWDQAGMVSDEVRQQFLARSVHMIPPAAGAEATLREIEAGGPRDTLVVLGEGPWSKIAAPPGTPRLKVLHAFGSSMS
jgi:acyl transferase domain-containing protein/NAD(P)-dependent dehydrogenase (short-subunit alcohol dehydrogenase family)/acyl carrier protein